MHAVVAASQGQGVAPAMMPQDGANSTPSTETELMQMAGFVQKPASAVMLCHLEQLQPNPHHDDVLTIEGSCCVLE